MTSVARCETVGQRVPAAVDVVELALGDRVVDVDRREQQRARLPSSGRGDARRSSSPRETPRMPVASLRPAARVALQLGAQRVEDDAPLLGLVVRIERRHRARPSRTRTPCARTASRRRRRRRSASGPLPSGHTSASFVHHQYSSSVSPFHAKTGSALRILDACRRSPGGPTTTAAAAWSCVEKMLHDTQRTSAPSSVSVSISTAVWMVMCRLPMMRAPASGFFAGVALAQRHQPGHLLLGEADFLAAELGEAQIRAPCTARAPPWRRRRTHGSCQRQRSYCSSALGRT